jgi:hypothetical protein
MNQYAIVYQTELEGSKLVFVKAGSKNLALLDYFSDYLIDREEEDDYSFILEDFGIYDVIIEKVPTN